MKSRKELLEAKIRQMVREELSKVPTKPTYDLKNIPVEDLKKKWKRFNDLSFSFSNTRSFEYKELLNFFKEIGFLDEDGVGYGKYSNPKLKSLSKYAESIA